VKRPAQWLAGRAEGWHLPGRGDIRPIRAAQRGPSSRAVSATASSTECEDRSPTGRRLFALTLGALGVVYGDIGTSPLYALRECFHGEYAVAVTPANVLGILSLVIWSLVLVISVKYLGFVLRADNRGEGGILALVALAVPRYAPRKTAWLALLGLFGASLLYGDGMLTPAISVLSAVEGIEVVTPALSPMVIPTTVAILLGLFAIQRRGTSSVGAMFGPVVIVWFVTIAVLGLGGIADHPPVLRAVLPHYAVGFFVHNGFHGFTVLAAVFLVVTGGEALYADMGHFGPRPIRWGWFVLALPALVLNYLGQGALLLSDPSAASSPFYRLAPEWAMVPLVALATAATVIASQALISGAFSLTHQAIQLGYAPRLAISHTSAEERGQIYVAPVNWMLAIAACGLVIGFGSSSNLAAAYGMSVTANMAITTVLLCVVAQKRWGWKRGAFALGVAFLPIDLAFFGSNILKLPHGGWFSLLAAGIVFAMMSTWKRGREVLRERLEEASLPLDLFLPDLETSTLPRVPGTAVFLTGDPGGTPPALLHNIKHNKVVHERTILLTIVTEDVPYSSDADRITMKALDQGFCRVVARYGFMEIPNVPLLLSRIRSEKFPIDLDQASYFLGREQLISTGASGMGRWREALFAYLSRNAQSANTYFRVPPNRVVELGAQVEL
jgi:KUP system potassium uptake protein